MSEELLNQIFKCEVAKVHDYGAFVKIPDSKQQGLVHRSQVSSTRVDDVTEILQQGERVWCKIISINDGKIALSMKVVDQGSGIDLDPNGVQIHLDDQKRKKGPDGFKKRSIELGAVFNTTCAKCGTRGHLSKDCFKGADGKTYALVSEDEEADVIITPPEVPEKIKKLKKDKKEKKEKKKRKDKKLSKVEKKKKEEKKDAVKNGRKKHYKSKKRKRSVSTSSSSSSSSSSSDSLSSSSSEDSSSDSSTHRSKRKRKRKKSESKPKKKSRR